MGITCQQVGEVGNGFSEGRINIIVDPVAYVSKVKNIEKTQGGADVEDDLSLRTRIFYAPKGSQCGRSSRSISVLVGEFSQAIEGVGVSTRNRESGYLPDFAGWRNSGRTISGTPEGISGEQAAADR